MSTTMSTNRLLNGRFRLLERRGRGGQGTVWLAEDTVLGREVALKQLIEPDDPARLPRQREYAMREAHALARVNHHNVVTIHDVFVVDQDPWLVMRYVLGKPLSKILMAGPLNEHQVASVTLQVLQGLSAAHRQGVLHRDVKPDNILVGDDNEIVLVDFGTAHVRGFPSLTDPQSLMCTPEFTAPERFDRSVGGGQAVSTAADLWSLGVTMFFAIEGYSPFLRGGEHPGLATMNAVLYEALPAMNNAGALSGLIKGLLKKHPKQRLDGPEAERILTAVLRDARHVQVPLSRPSPPDRHPSDGWEQQSGPATYPAHGDRSTQRAAGEPRRISELSDGPAAAWLLNQPTDRAAAALLEVGSRRADRVFRHIAEVRPDAAAEILAAWREDEAGRALGQLPPLLVARVLEAIVLQSPDEDAADAVRAIRKVGRPAVLAAAFDCLPRPLTVAMLEQIPDEQGVSVLQEMDPAMVWQLQYASLEVVGRLLRQTPRSFQAQVARHATARWS
jgi:eukaryotic-like serine/threonine-protein kinase